MKIISNIITAVLFINLIIMSFLVISSKASGGEPKVFGYQLKTVLSGSMEPTFKTGSVIAVKPLSMEEKQNLKKGEIVTFMMDGNKLVTHRIHDVRTVGVQVLYVTKGDNNKTADIDSVLADNVVAQYTGFTVPYLGYFNGFTQSKEGSALLLIGPGLLFLAYAGYNIFKGFKEIEPKKEKTESEETVA